MAYLSKFPLLLFCRLLDIFNLVRYRLPRIGEQVALPFIQTLLPLLSPKPS